MPSNSKIDKSSLQVAVIFLVTGTLALFIAVFYNVQTMAFIGLGFTFWGAIFALARKGNYVESNLLDDTAKSAYATYERMINEFKYDAKGYYIPAYPQDAYIPDYLKKLKEPIVFISEDISQLEIEELIYGKFLSVKSKGIFIAAPGGGLMAEMEKKVSLDFSKLTLPELCGLLTRCTTEVFNLAKSMEINLLENGANLRATGILYESLYRSDKNLQAINILGCPVVSSVACALAKTSGKTVVIRKQTLTPNKLGVDVLFDFVGSGGR